MSVAVSVAHSKPEPGDTPIDRQLLNLSTALVLVNHMFHNHHVVPVRVQQIECRTGFEPKVVICCDQYLDLDLIDDWHYRAGQEMASEPDSGDGYAYTFVPPRDYPEEFNKLLEMVQAYVHMIPSLQASPATLVRT